jgi:type IV pilus assembly protein PilN
MARINLLPWRDEQRQEKKKEFFTVIGGVCILGVLCGYIWVSGVQSSIDNQNSRNARLKEEIAVLQKQVDEIKNLKQRRSELLARMNVIQNLEGTRPVIVRYFDELVRAIPEGLWIVNLQRTGETINIQGIGESTQRVSTLMRNLDGSEWFQDANVSSLDASPADGEQAQKFNITVKTAVPVQDQAKGAGS